MHTRERDGRLGWCEVGIVGFCGPGRAVALGIGWQGLADGSGNHVVGRLRSWCVYGGGWDTRFAAIIRNFPKISETSRKCDGNRQAQQKLGDEKKVVLSVYGHYVGSSVSQIVRDLRRRGYTVPT